MVQATELTFAPRRPSDTRLITGVSAAHFVSHYYILLLPPLFVFVRADYDVSYTELGLALTAFNVVSAILQTPAGILVDRVGAKLVLIGGLLIGATAFALAGLVHSFWIMVAMFGVAGIGNAVYHPADYAVLSQQVASERMGRAYSIHTFAGMLGSAVAPGSLFFMQSIFGWRGAFIGAAMLGLIVATALALLPGMFGEPYPAGRTAAAGGSRAQSGGWRLLLSGPILRNFVFFILFSVTMAGMQNYSVVALAALYQTPLASANAALTGFLLLSALGVLAGGFLVGHTSRHGLVTVLCFFLLALVGLLVGLVDLTTLALIAAMAFGGLVFGIVMPSRDLLVREVTPPGAFGTVFGFVTTGFNVAGIFSPLIFGAVMDHGQPRAVFMLVVLCSILAILTVATRSKARVA